METQKDETGIKGKLLRFAGENYSVATDRDLLRSKHAAEALLTWNADVKLRTRFDDFAAYLKHSLTAKGL